MKILYLIHSIILLLVMVLVKINKEYDKNSIRIFHIQQIKRGDKNE